MRYLLGLNGLSKVLVRLNRIIEHRVLRGMVLAVTQLGELVTPLSWRVCSCLTPGPDRLGLCWLPPTMRPIFRCI